MASWSRLPPSVAMRRSLPELPAASIDALTMIHHCLVSLNKTVLPFAHFLREEEHGKSGQMAAETKLHDVKHQPDLL